MGAKKENRRFWSRWAGWYDGFMHSSEPIYDAMTLRMKKQLNRQMQVLELACGTGMVSRRIAGSVKSLEATDFSPEMIAEAKKKAASSRLHFSVQDATCLSYGAESFDAVIVANALHIVPDPEAVLIECRRVLKPEGLLIAPTFVHGEGVGFRLRTGVMKLAGFRVFHKWSAREFADFVAGCGFAVTQQSTMGSGIAPLCYLEARRTAQ